MEFLEECKTNQKAWESVELAKLQIQKGPGDIPGTILKKDLFQGIVLLQLEITELKKSLEATHNNEEQNVEVNDDENKGKELQADKKQEVSHDKEAKAKELINTDKKDEKSTGKGKICQKHLINQCPNPKGCKFEHPARCFKIMHYGLKQFDDRGCDLTCNKMHPRMCHKDMKYGNCKDRNCKKRHLATRGNTRPKSSISNRSPEQGRNNFPRKNWSREPEQQKSISNQPEPPSTFLEMQKMMKEMMLFQQQMMQEFLRRKD